MVNFEIHGQLLPYKRLSRDDNYLKVLPEHKVGAELIDKWHKIQEIVVWKEQVAEIAAQAGVNYNQKGIIYLNIKIHLSSKKHADIYDYWLNIADSIFKSKKYVCGSFELIYDMADKAECIVSSQPESADLFTESEPEAF